MGLTIQQAVDTIIAAVPRAPLPDTVDTFKVGNASQKVTGIVTCFVATYEVIEQAIHLGANLVITHEPVFYNHHDETNWLRGDAVYEAKRRLIDEHHIVIWRFHDYLHLLPSDSTIMGLLKTLDWEAYALPERPYVCRIPPMSLREVGDWLKAKLEVDGVRLIGELDRQYSKVGLAVGAAGGEVQIEAMGHNEVEILVCGEIHEWETGEYARDAVHLGYHKALVVIGHAPSEEAGMKWLTPWLQSLLPGISFTFAPTGSPFR